MLDRIFQHLLTEDEDYINVRKVVGDRNLEFFAQNVEVPGNRDREDFAQKLVEIADILYMKFQSSDTIELNPQNFNEDLLENWNQISKRFTYNLTEQASEDEDFPIIVDVFQVNGITFGLQAEDREDSLEEAMNFFVEIEDYEMAAKARDALQETKQ